MPAKSGKGDRLARQPASRSVLETMQVARKAFETLVLDACRESSAESFFIPVIAVAVVPVTLLESETIFGHELGAGKSLGALSEE